MTPTMSVKALTFQASDRQEEKINEADGERDLPSVRYMPIVHSFHGQSVAPPYSELNTWCHSNDPGAVKTVHSVLLSVNMKLLSRKLRPHYALTVTIPHKTTHPFN